MIDYQSTIFYFLTSIGAKLVNENPLPVSC